MPIIYINHNRDTIINGFNKLTTDLLSKYKCKNKKLTTEICVFKNNYTTNEYYTIHNIVAFL